MLHRFVITSLSFMLMLEGCASQMWWYKPGFNQAQFQKDDYDCQRDATFQTGFVYRGIGSFGPETDRSLYTKCMQALGYTLGPPPNQTAVGTIKDGYRFKGGDPSVFDNWEAIEP